MSFSAIQDQVAPIRLMRNLIKRNRIPNGLLFWGPGGVGKRLTAMELAKAINCKEGEGDACDACLACRRVLSGNHPDVKVIVPSGKGRIIGVDTVDFMNDLAVYHPFEGGWRVFILQDADRMGVPAQNHFLKTLEEPPSNTLFILLTEYPRTLLPTIRSRCQQVRFGSLRPETVTALLLRERDLPPETAAAVAAVSQGQMSRALDIVDTEKRAIVLNVTERLAKGEDALLVSEDFVHHLRAREEAIRATVKAEFDSEEILEISKEDQEELKKDQLALTEALIRRDLMEYLYLLGTWYRDELVYAATGQTDRALNRDQAERFQETDRTALEAKLRAIEKAWQYIERNLSAERVFRDLFFTLAA